MLIVSNEIVDITAVSVKKSVEAGLAGCGAVPS